MGSMMFPTGCEQGRARCILQIQSFTSVETIRGYTMLWATTATNTLAHGADIAKVRPWLGHANIGTTQMYEQRRSRRGESSTFKAEH
jgi:site-specific recombinase XerD